MSPLNNDLIDLSSVELFQYADMESLEGYLEHCEKTALQTGEVLLSPAADNHNIYVLLAGVLNIHLNSVKNPPINQVKPGECVGEISIIDRQDPSAFVVAECPSKLLVIPQNIVWAMINASHMIAKNLLYILARRLRHGHGIIMNGIKLQKQLQHHAMVDGLTGLHNRRWFDEAIQRKIKRNTIENNYLCLIIFDIDNFKFFNDEFGHLTGDQVIRNVAETLRMCMRPDDMSARFGGDEFVVLLPRTDMAEAHMIAERLRHRISQCAIYVGEQHLPPITISLGVASLQQGDSAETFFKRADEGLYAAKKQGRNCIVQIQAG